MMAKFATFAKYAIFLKIVALKGKPLHIKFRHASGDFLPLAPFSPYPYYPVDEIHDFRQIWWIKSHIF